MGRMRLSVCRGGEYPAMFLWITVAMDAAFMWTWLGPDPTAEDESRAVLQIVQGARRRPSTSHGVV